MHLLASAWGPGRVPRFTSGLRGTPKLPFAKRLQRLAESAPGNRGPRFGSVSVRGVLHGKSRKAWIVAATDDQDFGKAY